MTAEAKPDLAVEAGDGSVIGRLCVGRDGVLALGGGEEEEVRARWQRDSRWTTTYRWDLARELHLGGDGNGTRLDGTLEVNVLDLFTQVKAHVDDLDKADSDGDVNVGAFLDDFLDDSGGRDGEVSAAVEREKERVCE